MKEHPILFSTPMVQAILEGGKTQTRRVIKPQEGLVCRYGHPGDLLYVRETFAPINHPEVKYRYRADHLNPKSVIWKPSIFMPKAAARIWLEITWAKVGRVQDISTGDAIAEGISQVGDTPVLWNNYLFGTRLAMWPGYGSLTKTYGFTNPVDSFRTLFEKINGPAAWIKNPWVWAIKFKVISTTGMKSPQPPFVKGDERR